MCGNTIIQEEKDNNTECILKKRICKIKSNKNADFYQISNNIMKYFIKYLTHIKHHNIFPFYQ